MLEEIKSDLPTQRWKCEVENGDDHYSEEIIEQSEKALDIFVDNLILLGEKTNEKDIFECIKAVVLRFNELDEEYFFIETIEREELCEFISKAASLVGLKIDGDVTEEWREW